MNGTTSANEGTTGVVLAGGRSRRFGETDKGLARVGGEPLVARVVSRLSDSVENVVVNCRADQREALEDALGTTMVPVRFAEDPSIDRGPLYGFSIALERVETERCVLTTCDTPFLDSRMLSDLAERVRSGGSEERADAATVRTPDGRVHPEQAVYRTSPARSAAETLLSGGERRLSALLDRLSLHAVPADEVAGNASRSLFDVDTPADYERAAEMLSERPTDRSTPTPTDD